MTILFKAEEVRFVPHIAVGVRFELTVPFYRYTTFRVWPIQPLWHPTAIDGIAICY